MTDVTTDADREPAALSAADEQLLRELTERARKGGLQLTGEGGLLGKLTKMVVEGALEGARRSPGLCEGRPGGPQRRELQERAPGQDGADRGRAGAGQRAAGPGRQLRAADHRQAAAAA